MTGNEVRRLRVARRLTQAKLAELAGVDRSTVVAVEKGRASKDGSLKRIADALGVAVERLRTDAEPMPDPVDRALFMLAAEFASISLGRPEDIGRFVGDLEQYRELFLSLDAYRKRAQDEVQAFCELTLSAQEAFCLPDSAIEALGAGLQAAENKVRGNSYPRAQLLHARGRHAFSIGMAASARITARPAGALFLEAEDLFGQAVKMKEQLRLPWDCIAASSVKLIEVAIERTRLSLRCRSAPEHDHLAARESEVAASRDEYSRMAPTTLSRNGVTYCTFVLARLSYVRARRFEMLGMESERVHALREAERLCLEVLRSKAASPDVDGILWASGLLAKTSRLLPDGFKGDPLQVARRYRSALDIERFRLRDLRSIAMISSLQRDVADHSGEEWVSHLAALRVSAGPPEA